MSQYVDTQVIHINSQTLLYKEYHQIRKQSENDRESLLKENKMLKESNEHLNSKLELLETKLPKSEVILGFKIVE